MQRKQILNEDILIQEIGNDKIGFIKRIKLKMKNVNVFKLKNGILDKKNYLIFQKLLFLKEKKRIM